MGTSAFSRCFYFLGLESHLCWDPSEVPVIEQDHTFLCPYCGEDLSARLDPSGGRRQKFVQDCEVCCKPIQIEVHFAGDEVTFFSAEVGD